MSNMQISRMVTRLTDTSQIRSEDYLKELDKKMVELSKKCEKMYSTIDLFQLMSGNDMSIRCMQHNNMLNLYCLTEHKVLCVNCTYGDTKHKTHKVLPLKDSVQHIVQDNKTLTEVLKNDIRGLQLVVKNANENVRTLNSSLNQVLKNMK
jgi:hypothetical protein